MFPYKKPTGITFVVLTTVIIYFICHKKIERDTDPELLATDDLSYEKHNFEKANFMPAKTNMVKLLCWVPVTKATINEVNAVNSTWLKRCDRTLFVGDTTTTGLNDIISLNVTTGRQYLWFKTRDALQYIYNNYFDDYDWFFKADTDTYVIVENLRYVLSTLDDNQPQYVGLVLDLNKTHNNVNLTLQAGGPGYVLNKLALKKLITQAYKNESCYKGFRQEEDVMLGWCFQLMKVNPHEPTDEQNRTHFFPMTPYYHVAAPITSESSWYWKIAVRPAKTSIDCCSKYAISFHFMTEELIWAMEYSLYHIKIAT
ncbi:hypothetical protein CHUAL_012392 [Chamberlinius hualienensis]